MANYATLIAAIQAVIKANGNNEITGPILQSSLLSMIASLGAGYQFAGVAIPSTNPGTPDQNVFYLAVQSGTYSNFSAQIVDPGEIAVFSWNGTWAKQSINFGASIPAEVWASTTTKYYEDGTVYFGAVYVRRIGKTTADSYSIANTFSRPTGYTGALFYVLHSDGTVGLLQNVPLAKDDILLLERSSVAAGDIFTGGRLMGDYLQKRTHVYSRTIAPRFSMMAYRTDGKIAHTYYGKKIWSTGLIRCTGTFNKFIIKTTASTLQYKAYFWDASRNFISSSSFTTFADGDVCELPEGTQYFAVSIRLDGSTEIPYPDMQLQGEFPENWKAFGPRNSDGFQCLCVPVNIANPNSADAETATLQDSPIFLQDYGFLLLPPDYDPDGEPTRMIIFCHGAAGHYEPSLTLAEVESRIEPEFWLSEGFAVMDIEGNPFNNTNDHGYIPEAIQSYLAAYDFVTEHWNIRKDGVYLGGQSMGGGMCFEIMQSRIPVVAACPVVPVCNTLWWWEYMNATRRAFVAQKMGFTGTEPTWTTGSPMSAAEWQYLQDNFDKMVKYSPFWRGIESLPDKDTLFGVGNVGTFADNATEAALFGAQHFKVKAPVKMFAAKDDTSVYYARNCALMYQMLLNAAQVCEMRYFPSGGHHCALAASNRVATYVNSRGETLTDVPIAWIEMLQFWNRYALNFV